jgi:flagellin
MTALRSLTATNMALTETQNRVSTGLRVGSAADNAAYWSIATTMRSDSSALSTVQDALGLGAATVDVGYTATEAAIKTVMAIKDKLTAAAQPGLDRAKIQTEITELQASLAGTSSAASFQGQNWLSVDSSVAGYNATKGVVSSISRSL